MKTGMVLRLVTGLTLIALFASCAPASKDSKSYGSLNADQSNIVGGVTADLAYQQQHGIVGIFDAEVGALCTGSLIAKDLVITAAHCINVKHPEAMLVFFTTDMKLAIGMDQQGLFYDKKLVRAATKVLRHEKYVPEAESNASAASTKVSKSKKVSGPVIAQPTAPVSVKIENDIALIRLAADAPVEFVPATMAPSAITADIQAGNDVALAGFGLSAYKVDHNTHQVLKQGSGLLRKVEGIKVVSIKSTGEEVTFDQTQGRGACHGDSGGPAYFTDAKTSKTYLIGVTSRSEGSPLGECDQQVIYTGLMGYEAWIATHSQSL